MMFLQTNDDKMEISHDGGIISPYNQIKAITNLKSKYPVIGIIYQFSPLRSQGSATKGEGIIFLFKDDLKIRYCFTYENQNDPQKDVSIL